MLLWRTEGPERNRTATELGKPALELRLGSVVRQTRHVQNLAALRKESADVGAGIHGPSEHIRMLMRRLRLPDQTTEHAGESYSFLHSTARRRRRQGLQVEGQVVLDGGTGLDGLNLQGGANISQRRGPEGQ